MDIIGGIGSAIDLVKKAKHVADELKSLEMKGIVVDLQSQLIDLKEQILAPRAENIVLKEESAVRAKLPELIYKDGLYYTATDEGPYCSGCYDTKNKHVRLPERQQGLWALGGRWICPGCRHVYKS